MAPPGHQKLYTSVSMDTTSSDILNLLQKKKDAMARHIFDSDDEEEEAPQTLGHAESKNATQEANVNIEEDDDADAIKALPRKRAAALYAAKEKASQAPVAAKKPIFTDSSSEDDAFDDGYGEDLIGDEVDRRALMGMSEVEREQILFQRSTERQAKRERWELKHKMRAERTKTQPMSPVSRQPEPQKEKTLRVTQSIFTPAQSTQIIPFELVLPLQLFRRDITRCMFFASFRSDAVGLFVLNQVRNGVYHFHRIVHILDSRQIYNVHNRSGSTAIRCRYSYLYYWEGKPQHGRFDFISNSPAKEEDYKEWLRQWEVYQPDSKSQPITTAECELLSRRLEGLRNHVEDDQDFKHLTEEKSRLGLYKRNLVQERQGLLETKQVLLQLVEDEKAGVLDHSIVVHKKILEKYPDRIAGLKEIEAKLKDLEIKIKAQAQSTGRGQQMNEIERKNRERNYERAHEAEVERKRLKLAQEAVEGPKKLDPTARRITRSTFGDAIAAASDSQASLSDSVVAPVPQGKDNSEEPFSQEEKQEHSQIFYDADTVDNGDQLGDLDIDMGVLKKASTRRKEPTRSKPSSNGADPSAFLEQFKKEHGIF